MLTERDILDAVAMLRGLANGRDVLNQASANLTAAISQLSGTTDDATLETRDILVALREMINGRSANTMTEEALTWLSNNAPDANTCIAEAAKVSQTFAGKLATWYGAVRRAAGLQGLAALPAVLLMIAIIILASAALVWALAEKIFQNTNALLVAQGKAPLSNAKNSGWSTDLLPIGLLLLLGLSIFAPLRKKTTNAT